MECRKMETVKQLCFVLAIGLIGIDSTEIDFPKTIDNVVKPEDVSITRKEVLETSKALSTDLLTEIHKNRHDDLVKRVEALTLSDDQVDTIKKNALTNYEKRLTKPNFDRSEVEANIEKIKAMKSSDLKKQLIETLGNNKNYDTVAVKVTQDINNKKYVAISANIKTIDIGDLHNPKLWQTVLTNDRSYRFDSKDLGLNSHTDLASIETVFSKEKYQLWGEKNGYDIIIVAPDPNNIYTDLKTQKALKITDATDLEKFIEIGKMF